MYIFYTKKFSKFLLFAFLAVVYLVLLSPINLHAETYVFNDDLRYGGTWDSTGSPYILNESVYIPQGYSLLIKPGVVIMSASSTDPNSLSFNGDLDIYGTKENPVKFIDLYSLYFSHSNVNIQNAIFENTGLDLLKSTSTIESTIIKGTQYAIYAIGSVISIKNSQIIDNKYGIASLPFSRGPFLMYENNGEDIGGIGGIGNALEGMANMIIDPDQNIISIHNSVIKGNSEYGLFNQVINPIDATDIWWGSKNGPSTDMNNAGDRIYGLANVTPWKDKDPNEGSACCSNVLFIPGIEASRLYKDSSGLFGTSTNTLWEPNISYDIEKLFLDSTGKSLDKSIYTSDIISSAFGFKDIYKSFIAMMNGVVADGTINQWLPFPYDWRMSVNDVVYGQTRYVNTGISLIDEIKKLASKSKTGKVIIISHSNGGLVTKVLMRALENTGESGLVEKIIFIAVPELGTPQALLSMLHGHNQSLAGGLLLSENTARTFSQNMLGAYGLLPSREYFNKNPFTLILNLFKNNSISLVSNYDEMKGFLTNNSFSMASSTNTRIPLLLNSSLLSSAESIHSKIDSWKPASTTKLISIFGWGLLTTKGVNYMRNEYCDQKIIGTCQVSIVQQTTRDGDGTVLTQSNANDANTSLFLNLKQFNEDKRKDIDHSNILEATALLSQVKEDITNTIPSDTDYKKYFTTTKPIDTDMLLYIRIHSPVDIHIYDKEGNHTGIIENPVIGKDLNKYETKIPFSIYDDYEGEKQIVLPYDDYEIVLKGTDAGVFYADAEITQFDKTIASTTFSIMPVTPLLNAEFIISTSTDSFATSSVINMDVDGDGTTDFVNHSKEFLNSTSTYRIADLSTYIESMKKVIIVLKLPENIKKTLMKRIDRIMKMIDKKNFKKAEKIIKKLSSKKFKNKKLNESEKTAILKVFENLLNRIEIDYKNNF